MEPSPRSEDDRVDRLAQPRARCPRSASKHRLDVGRRARDHAQDLAGRRLLLERLGQRRGCAPRSSLNSRTFSIAITAWSAKVWRSAICLSENGRASRAADGDRSDRRAFAQQRHGEDGPEAHARRRRLQRDELAIRPARRGRGRRRPSRMARPRHVRARPAIGIARLEGASPPRRRVCDGPPRWSTLAVDASRRSTRPRSHRLRRSAQRSCRTPAGGRSASCEMTRRISLVAVCCSSASVSSRLRACSSLKSRTFSMAITAWSAKVLSRAICRSENAPGLGASDGDRADRAYLRAASARRRCSGSRSDVARRAPGTCSRDPRSTSGT